MASSDNEVPQPIIVKKIKKGGGGHHGGAWKVAYADFVTAMMAFFLLMWLLNVTTKEELKAISNYFDPSHPKVSDAVSGAGGVLGGMSVSPEGSMINDLQSVAPPNTPAVARSGNVDGERIDQTESSDFPGEATEEFEAPEGESGLQDGINILDQVQQINEEKLEEIRAAIEAEQNQEFEAIKQTILEEVSKAPELADLLDQLMIDITPEGLRIQIVDKDGRSMFPSGSAQMHDFMKQLLTKVTQVIIPQSNQISVRGHTDGTQYAPGAAYDNWNLSSDRALASRKAILDAGLSPERVENVVGRADKEHLLPDEPLSPRNRRISVVLLRDPLKTAEQIKAAQDKLNRPNKTGGNTQPTEDRTNAPDLDRTIKGTTTFTIENQGQSQQNVPRPLPAPKETETPKEPKRQVLEFP